MHKKKKPAHRYTDTARTQHVFLCVRGVLKYALTRVGSFRLVPARQAPRFGSFRKKALVYYARPTPLHVSRVQKDERKYQKRNQNANNHSSAKSAWAAATSATATSAAATSAAATSATATSAAATSAAATSAADSFCTLGSWFQPRPVPCIVASQVAAAASQVAATASQVAAAASQVAKARSPCSHSRQFIGRRIHTV